MTELPTDYDGHVMRTPDEWCRIKGIQILDADGWRGRDAKDWSEPLTELDFEERAMVCTQRSVAPQPATESTIDPVLTAGPPRYRLWDGAYHYDDIDPGWSRDAVVAMARGLASFSRNTVRLVELTETEIQFGKEAKS